MRMNYGYNKHSDWHIEEPRPWNFGGFFNATLNNITVRIDIPPTLDSMTVTITKWEFHREKPTFTGDGFVDVIGFAWWDERDRTHFDDTHFVNSTRIEQNGVQIEPEYISEAERQNITTSQGSGYYDLDTWFYVWQGNEGRDRWGETVSPVGKSHTWPLTDADFLPDGSLRNRIVFVSYNRHLDNEGVTNTGGCILSNDPRHAHWKIDYEYWFSDGIWNWKYHPWAIRKGGAWYSCNRLNSEVGHGDGHMAIRKGGRWNAVWNDDYFINENEAHDDQENGGVGPYIPSPRVGIGNDAVRQKEDVHEWEE